MIQIVSTLKRRQLRNNTKLLKPDRETETIYNCVRARAVA